MGTCRFWVAPQPLRLLRYARNDRVGGVIARSAATWQSNAKALKEERYVKNHNYYVYILANRSHSVLYTGVTNNLERRVAEHRQGATPGFASKYRCNKLVWFEWTGNIEAAIAREKQIKAGSRAKKIALIESLNPDWRDLSE